MTVCILSVPLLLVIIVSRRSITQWLFPLFLGVLSFLICLTCEMERKTFSGGIERTKIG